MTKLNIPSVSVAFDSSNKAKTSNEHGMRPMQARAYDRRGEQYLLIKSPPASGKSRALMFVALDKLANQGVRKALVVVPERSIGASFNNEPLSQFGFFTDWVVEPCNNLCDSSGEETSSGKVKAVERFLESDEQVLVCTHATFRFAVDSVGIEAFDDCLIAVDEFHHVSANPENRLGAQLADLMERDKAHIVAMTGSYFRGDAEAVLSPENEARFATVTFTYYEQLSGYEHLKELDLGYYFYSGDYLDEIDQVLVPNEKTIIHIPNVNSRESSGIKYDAVEAIIEGLGEWKGTDPETGFQLVEVDGLDRPLRIADLVDDEPLKRAKVLGSIKDPTHKNNRDHVDMIIALGMAKEGFDWIWCEHALTVGYRSSLTEVVQIIGRATRDAPGKKKARFTNLIAEPAADETLVTEAVNDTLKAIGASLLMEQVLIPKFEFTPKSSKSKPQECYDYGEDGYEEGRSNIGFNEANGTLQVEIAGLKDFESVEAAKICNEDINEVIAAITQDKPTIEQGMFDEEAPAQDITQMAIGRIIKDKYPNLSENDCEAVRQRAVAAMNLVQEAKRAANPELEGTGSIETGDNFEKSGSSRFLDGVRKFAMDVRDLNVDLIDSINPFNEAYSILSKTMNENSLKALSAAIAGKRVSMTFEEAKDYALRAKKWIDERGKAPEITSNDAWERKLAEGIQAFKYHLQKRAEG